MNIKHSYKNKLLVVGYMQNMSELVTVPKFGHHIIAKYENFTEYVCLNVGVKSFG